MASAVVVARTKLNGLEYLAENVREGWTEASDLAARFQTVREATRAAMRLPSRFRAFALPLHSPADV
jgi:hypothetical protein